MFANVHHTWAVKGIVKIPGHTEKIEFTSLKLMKLFLVQPGLEQATHTYLEGKAFRKQLRIRINATVALVNDNDGWTVTGWARTGENADITDDANRVASDTIIPHIILMEPTTFIIEDNMKLDVSKPIGEATTETGQA